MRVPWIPAAFTGPCRESVLLDPTDALGLSGCEYGYGWYVCDRYGEDVYRHHGKLSGQC